jgi:hypothetical protein
MEITTPTGCVHHSRAPAQPRPLHVERSEVAAHTGIAIARHAA